MRILRELDLEIARFYEKCEISDSIIGLRNGILTALLILEAAEQIPRKPRLPLPHQLTQIAIIGSRTM